MLLLLLACTRHVAPILEVEPTTPVAPEPSDPTERLAWMVGADPLARRPRLPTSASEGPLASWLLLARADDSRPSEWAELEARWPGTVAVPLARGARLAGLEASLDAPDRAMDWFLPLPIGDAGQEQNRPPLDWLQARPDALLPMLERSVTLGWLDGPAIPVASLVGPLRDPAFARVASTPTGALLLARAEGRQDPNRAATGWTHLEEATALAARVAAADRDAEQAAVRAELLALEPLYGKYPVGALLGLAAEQLGSDAGSNASTGGALLALAAQRWQDRCADPPCGGFDRVRAMATAGRWDPRVAPLAEAWLAIASKDAVDHLEAAWDDPSFPSGLDAVTEVLLGTGGSVDRGLLRYPRPGAPALLALSRAAGAGNLTSKDDVIHALRRRTGAQARSVATRAPAGLREPMEKIAKRGE